MTTKLQRLRPGTVITLKCMTTDANIYLKCGTRPGLPSTVPNQYQLRQTRYTVAGTFRGVEHHEGRSYARIDAIGEAAVLDVNGWKVVGTQYRMKQIRVPLSAIVGIE